MIFMLQICRLRLSKLCLMNSYRFASTFGSIVENQKCENYCKDIVDRFNRFKTEGDKAETVTSEIVSRWQSISELYGTLENKKNELKQLQDLQKENSDDELASLVEQDLVAMKEEIDEVSDQLAQSIVPMSELDFLNKCQLEFAAGAGGSESMVFAEEIFEMYRRYAEYRGWNWLAIQHENVSNGGLRSAVVLLEGQTCYSDMRFEAGIHRVQRIPFNASIMHTSTMSLAVLPEPENPEMALPSNEVKIETMRASGPGGQNVNKRSTAVRMTHLPTGISVHCMDERFQHMNIKIAYKRLAAILLQQKIDNIFSKTTSARKLQVGSRARAEKIRTFNFKDDRITDHRLRMSLTHLESFMKGGEGLDTFIRGLKLMDLKERLEEEIGLQLVV